MSIHKDLEKTSAASTAASGGPDVRQGEVEIANYLDAGIKRGLKSRHIQMIALGGDYKLPFAHIT
jgi:amino acid permease